MSTKLSKHKVVWTQTRPLPSHLIEQLDSLDHIFLPSMRMEATEDPGIQSIDLESFESIYFVSQWAVDFLKQEVDELPDDIFCLAAGQKTAAYVEERYGRTCHVRKRCKSSTDLFRYLSGQDFNQSMLVPVSKNSLGKYKALQEKYLPGINLCEIPVYTCSANWTQEKEVKQVLVELTDLDYLVLSSGLSFRFLLDLLGDNLKYCLEIPKIISIGPVTSQTITDLGYTVYLEADPSNNEGLLARIQDDWKAIGS